MTLADNNCCTNTLSSVNANQLAQPDFQSGLIGASPIMDAIF